MQKLLFVCLGNICRSPMAEAIARDKIKKADLAEKIAVSSAATSHWELGSIPHAGTRAILDRLNISYEGMYAKQITAKEFQQNDYIIGMDANNIKDLKRMAPQGTENKIYLFMDSVSGKAGMDVPDPYYTGDFEQTVRLIDEGIQGWLKKVQEKE